MKLVALFYFDVHKSKIKKRLVKIGYKEEDVYFTSGVYIAPYAQSPLQDNEQYISRLLLDTTFKVFPYYVTLILMVNIMNAGNPISFSFGKSETKELYEKHFQTFKNETGIDLCIYKFESDQSVALQSIIKEKHIEHYICLRHLLASIKYY